jgi:hypothetical protein
MRRNPLVPESQSTWREIKIVPQCIFCHQPTDNVETRVTNKMSEQRWSSTQVLRTTSTNVIPFPAHHRCYRRRWLAQRITAILTGVTIVLAVPCGFAITSIVGESVARLVGPRGLLWTMLGPLFVPVLLMFTSLGLWMNLNAKVEHYAKEHQVM